MGVTDVKMLQELKSKASLMYRMVLIIVLVFKEYKAGKNTSSNNLSV